MLVRILEKEEPLKLRVELDTEVFDDDLQGYNVLAELPGSDPELREEIVMLGAHLDSWHAGTGATDNASGCAVVMEAVRILKAVGGPLRRTVRIALWSGEEQGLLGAKGYVKSQFGDPAEGEVTDEYSDFSAYFNLDNGAGRIRGIYLQGNDSVRPIFSDYIEPLEDLGVSTLSIRRTGGTDHLAFDAIGLPGFQFIQDPLNYGTVTHHTNLDVYEYVPEEDLSQASAVMAWFVYRTAMRDARLPRKKIN
jgi:Zn-dependent M28 family amino/carboxypeptidase